MIVYIKGIELPKDDHVRVLVLHSDGKIIDEWGNTYQAVSVPAHGRLGDLDRLERMFADIDNAPYSGFDGEEPFYSADDAAQIIRLAPTIIPAEEGET